MINKRKAYNCTTYLGRKQNFEKVLCNLKKGNEIENIKDCLRSLQFLYNLGAIFI